MIAEIKRVLASLFDIVFFFFCLTAIIFKVGIFKHLFTMLTIYEVLMTASSFDYSVRFCVNQTA